MILLTVRAKSVQESRVTLHNRLAFTVILLIVRAKSVQQSPVTAAEVCPTISGFCCRSLSNNLRFLLQKSVQQSPVSAAEVCPTISGYCCRSLSNNIRLLLQNLGLKMPRLFTQIVTLWDSLLREIGYRYIRVHRLWRNSGNRCIMCKAFHENLVTVTPWCSFFSWKSGCCYTMV